LWSCHFGPFAQCHRHVCKYRKKLLVRFGEQVKQLMRNIEDEKGFEIVKMEVDKDHIHLLARYSPKYSALQIVRLLKQIFTFRLWRTNGNYQFLKRHFSKEHTFWSDGYFACSIRKCKQEHHPQVHPEPRMNMALYTCTLKGVGKEREYNYQLRDLKGN
jgi:putative transposase